MKERAEWLRQQADFIENGNTIASTWVGQVFFEDADALDALVERLEQAEARDAANRQDVKWALGILTTDEWDDGDVPARAATYLRRVVDRLAIPREEPSRDC